MRGEEGLLGKKCPAGVLHKHFQPIGEDDSRREIWIYIVKYKMNIN